MAMTLLPRFFVLQSGGRYLSVTENLSASLPSGFLKFDEEQIWNPRVKFAVERAETGDVQLKPEKDQSKVSCTLFELHPVLGNTGALRLRFLRNGTDAGRLLPHCTTNVAIHDGVTVSPITSPSEFNVINWETLVILPTHVSFRSEELDGNYLCSCPLDPSWPYQMFKSGMDVGDPLVAKELFPTPNGNYRIKDVHFGKFWRRSPNWIWADAEDNNSSNDTLFSIVKISGTVIALRNLGNNRFCAGLPTEEKTNCLNAHYPTISRQARLVIEERVLEREISDIRYRLSDSRIYQEEIQEVSNDFATNDSPDKESKITLNYSISDSRTTHWTNSVSMSLVLES
nr:hypothetical protein [Tanacetum cinerariifolium]